MVYKTKRPTSGKWACSPRRPRKSRPWQISIGWIAQGGHNLPGWPPRVPSKSVEGLVFQDENMMGKRVSPRRDGALWSTIGRLEKDAVGAKGLARNSRIESPVQDPLQPRIVTVPATWAESCDRDPRGDAAEADYVWTSPALFEWRCGKYCTSYVTVHRPITRSGRWRESKAKGVPRRRVR